MGRPFYEYFDGRCYCCNVCKRHLAKSEELVSTQFHSKNGQAYLFHNAVNVLAGPKEERLEEAYDKTQKYKEGKYILERCKIAEDAGSDSDCPYDESDEDEL